MAYTLPLRVSLASAAALTLALSAAVRVSAWTWFALTMASILPPPRWKKMSGAVPEFSAVCSLPSRLSFWMVCILTVTPGWDEL